MRGELTRETRTRMTECSLSSRSKEGNGWNGCTESRRICGRHIFRRGDIHVARDTAKAAAGANLHAGTMRPTSGRHKWRPYVFPYTGRTTGLLRRGDIHVARDTAGAAAGAFTGGPVSPTRRTGDTVSAIGKTVRATGISVALTVFRVRAAVAARGIRGKPARRSRHAGWRNEGCPDRGFRNRPGGLPRLSR